MIEYNVTSVIIYGVTNSNAVSFKLFEDDQQLGSKVS